MQIFVRNVSGQCATYNVAADASVAEVMHMVEDREFIPASCQRLVCGGKQLTAGLLSEFGITEADTLSLLLNVEGGMRAKWRKKRMRRLRRKRRKMRQRAR